MAPWLAITSATPRPVLSAALGSSLRGQTETITSSVPVSVDRQQKKLSSGVGAAQAPDGSGRPVLGSALELGILPTTHSLLPTICPGLAMLGRLQGAWLGPRGPRQPEMESSPS